MTENTGLGSLGLVISTIVLIIFGILPLCNEVIEPEVKIGMGEKWNIFTLTGYTYSGKGSFVVPRVYTLVFTTNGIDYSFSFEDVPAYITLQGTKFTIIDYDRERRTIDIVSGHPIIRKITFLGLITENIKEVVRRSGARSP